jgi:PPOX class probable F420-dependent enzyme
MCRVISSRRRSSKVNRNNRIINGYNRRYGQRGQPVTSSFSGAQLCVRHLRDHGQVPSETLSWPEVSSRLAAARNYWLVSTTPSGSPHAAPVWGVVTGETLYLYSERGTVKARNIAADPRVVVHLESGDDVVIVRGVAEDLGAPSQVPSVVAALAAKYTRPEDRQYLPDADPGFDVVYAIRPRSAMMWRLADYAASQRRWPA